MVEYTAAQKRAYAIKMAKARAAAAQPIVPMYVVQGKGADKVAKKKKRAVSRVPKALAEESIGSQVGGKIGSFLGDIAQKIVKKISGFGEYETHENSLLQGGMSPPQIINSINQGGFIVRHREYIQDINATTAFTLQAFDINPGISSSFPWLAQQAANYEQYRFRGLIYEFKSLSSDAVLSSATSSALGSVIMATEYNAANPNFVDKKQMENYEFANSDKPSCSFMHPVECAAAQTPVDKLYVRTGSIPSGQDQRLYDLGNFQIATVGMQAASGVAGELWCTYEIEFYKPKLDNTLGLQLLTDHFKLTGVTNSVPLGTAGTSPVSGSNLGCVISTSTGSIVTFPAGISDGYYLVCISWTGTSTVSCVAPGASGTNATFLNVWTNDAASSVSNSGTTTTVLYNFLVNITAQGASFKLNTSGTLPASVTSGDMWITQVNGNIVT